MKKTAALLLALALMSCSGQGVTEIVIETGTDYAPGTELARVEWELRSNATEPLSPRPSQEIPVGFEGFPLTLTTTPESTLNAPLEVTVRGLRADGSVLAMQTRRTAFVPGASLALRVELTRRCEEAACAESETCASIDDEARCIDIDIDPSLVPPHRPNRPTGAGELCNGRDDDADGFTDEDFDVGSNPRHCGACHAACEVIEGGNGRAVCVDEECGYECDALFGDCDGDPSNGCETRLTDPDACGACDTTCAPPTSLCAIRTDGAECVDMCTGSTTNCDGSCVDTFDSRRHCGGCGQACVAPELGSAECEDGECLIECDLGAHPCDGTCVSDTDVNFCAGDDRCSPCPTDAANVASVACVEQVCVSSCEEDFADCDGDPTNGCEATPSGDDPRNCGECGIDCGYGTCSAGVCSNAVRSFAVGARHACAALEDGSVWCWGANELGQSTIRPTSGAIPKPAFVMQSVEPQLTFRALDDTTSYIESNAILSGISILFWGDDPRDEIARPVGSRTVIAGSATGLLPFDVGGGSGFLLDGGSTGGPPVELFGWGSRDFGAFADFISPGIGPIPLRRLETVNTLPAFANLARGERVTCGVSGTGLFPDLLCWGLASSGERVFTGNGTDRGAASPSTITSPVPSARFTSDSAMDLGYQAACAPFAEPSAASRFACWGVWDCGFPTREVLEPTEVAGTNNANSLSLSVGASQACGAQVGTGRMICWGRDYENPDLASCRPAQTEPYPEYTDINRVQLGREFGCFLRRVGGDANSGSLFCWGSNREGQLGTGETAATSGPHQVVFSTPPPG
ncbi:MAG: hypothetical protein AB8I08_10455 [Sandaracinaceae bacterium]